MEIADLIPQNAYIVCIILFIIGMILKQTPQIKNWMIPYLLSVVGIIICNLILEPGVYATIQGILTTGFTVYAHQIGKQGTEIFSMQEKNTANSTNKTFANKAVKQ
ncbi:MAG: phage holin family protein [Oscillospiraceae bacterium]|jgi:hypothetical protein|nr:phage holin family protein [Oscillospiraceae bacterium]